MMAPTPSTTIIVFHSYPQKPCIDGLLAAIIATWIYQKSSKVHLVPYSRTQQSFERLRQTVEETKALGSPGKQQIVYVDCTPDLDDEVNYLAGIVTDVPVTVYDHHQMRDDAPVWQLQTKKNFKLHFDPINCAAKMMYQLLTDVGDNMANYGIDDLLTIVQFSEYEGMNFKAAGKLEAEAITKTALRRALNPSNEELLERIDDMGMSLFYILDQVLCEEKYWAFFTDNNLSSAEVYQRFEVESKRYLHRTNLVLSGHDKVVYSTDKLTAYLDLMNSLPCVLASGKVVENVKIAEQKSNVLVLNINIFTFGRSLEPMVLKELQKRGASYAILMNDPTKNRKTGALSYYFSLRRAEDAFSARDLAFYLKDLTGSKIGGGHPWGSGVTLNEEEYQKFLKDFLNQ